MPDDLPLPKSAMPGVEWPAIPVAVAATHLALQFQLQQTQWWPPERLRQMQFRQAQHLLAHACRTVPHYRQSFGQAGIDPTREDARRIWPRVPILTREALQAAGDRLNSQGSPKAHGKLERMQSSGSTGRPVSVLRTELSRLLWQVFTVRDHLWHRRDLSGKLAAIRTTGHGLPPEGQQAPSWGAATDVAYTTGPSALLNIGMDVEHQRLWLIEQNPHYVLTHPTNLRELAKSFAKHGGKLPKLLQARTMGETLPEDLRSLVREVFGVGVADMYSAEEVGYMALQCPDHEHYHVQSEAVLLEVLDDDDQPCEPGQVGRVVVTVLHNFATPLIRYQIMDYAQVGAPCPCGRGLPVLSRIMGRQRNMVVLPDGRRHWPSFPAHGWMDSAPIRQIQLVQRVPERIEVRIVIDRDLTAEQRKRFIAALHERLGYPFEIDIQRVDRIEPKANNKYEDFVSLIAP